MKRISIILLALLPFVGISQSGYQINGNVDVDQNIWQPLVYLSIIETFEDMSTVSPAMVFDDATLDENGRFVFNGEFLPTGERIYRLHLRKWDDPLSTIIIGGNEHNHLHFAMSPGDTIRINSGQRVFGEATIIGGESNDCIQEAYRMAEMRFDAGGMSDNYSMREERAARGLIDIVESCPAQLGSLFSAFKILQKFDDTDEAARLPEVLNDKSYSESVYTKEVMAWKSMKLISDSSSDVCTHWPRPVCSRAKSAARIAWVRNVPAATSEIAIPARHGPPPGGPVTLIRPASPCTIGSRAGRSASGPAWP